MKGEMIKSVLIGCFFGAIIFMCFFFAFTLSDDYQQHSDVNGLKSESYEISAIAGVASSRDWIYNYFKIVYELEKIEPGSGSKFVTNVMGDMNEEPEYDPEIILLSAFSWKDSPEGNNYWAKIMNKIIEANNDKTD